MEDWRNAENGFDPDAEFFRQAYARRFVNSSRG